MATFTEGICADGAAILKDGLPLTVGEILAHLNSGADLLDAAKAFVEPYAAWRDDVLRNVAAGKLPGAKWQRIAASILVFRNEIENSVSDDRPFSLAGKTAALRGSGGEPMSYDYATERASVFTEQGQKMFLKIRDKTQALLRVAGACRMQEMTSGNTGDSWEMIACVDRLVELGEIVEVPRPGCAGQHRVFVGRSA